MFRIRSNINGSPQSDLTIGWVLTLFFSAVYPVYTFMQVGSPARLVIYALPAISILLWIILPREDRRVIDRNFLYLTISFFFVVIISSFSGHMSSGYMKEAMIIFGIFIIFIPKFEVTDQMILVLLLGLFAAVLVQLVTIGINVKFSLNLQKSEGLLENVFGLTFPVFAIYYAVRKKRLLFCISIILSIISFKRIALAGMVAALMFFVFCVFTRGSAQRGGMLFHKILTVMVVVACIIVSFYFVPIIDFLYFDLGVIDSVLEATSGRYAGQKHFTAQVYGQDWLGLVFGNGPDSSTLLGQDVIWSTLSKFHNDWLKLLYEYGAIGLIAYVILFTRVHMSSLGGMSILLFTAILYITDNSFQYIFHQFPALMMVRHLQQLEES